MTITRTSLATVESARRERVEPTGGITATNSQKAMEGLDTGKVSITQLGVANGVATLDSGGKLTAAQIPTALVGALQYQGTWNASTNTPTLASGVGTKGFYYKVSVAGSTSIDGISQWNVGDSIIFDGTTWDKIDGLANEVISVAGRTGVVTLASGDVSGLAPSATTDTTNATNISSGTLAAARMAAFGSGDVSFATGGGAGTIAANAVTYAKLAAAAQGLTFTRLAKTAAYPVVNADKGSTIALGGSAFYTLTFGAASGYDANFPVIVINEDAGRGKTISCNGLSSFILWPGQSVLIQNQNNVWKIGWLARWTLTAGVTFNIDPINGLDTNDGLAAGAGGAFLTPAKAASVLANSLDCGSQNVTIQYAAGTYTDLPFVALGYVGNGTVTLQGDTGTPTNVICIATSVLAPFNFNNGNGCYNGNYVVQGFYIKATQNGSFGIFIQGGNTRVSWANNNFGGFPQGTHVGGQMFAQGMSNGGNTISGGASFHCQAVDTLDMHFTGGVDTFANPTVTITIATPGVVTLANHGFTGGHPFTFANSGGALPTGITAGTLYYVVNTGITASTFQFSLTQGGASVATSGSQSGTQSIRPYFITDVLDGHGQALIGTSATNWAGNAGGKRFNMALASLLDTAGTSTTLPGSIAGTPVSGDDTHAGSQGYTN